MREILFRGKDNDGVWQEGFYCLLNDKSHRIYTGYAETDCGTYYPNFYTVQPSTVGQYTGLTDKNGTRIFEGDIVQSIELELKGIIVFDEHCRFMIKDFSTGSTYLISYNNDEIQVIGNIHDNPELLESEVNNNV